MTETGNFAKQKLMKYTFYVILYYYNNINFNIKRHTKK